MLTFASLNVGLVKNAVSNAQLLMLFKYFQVFKIFVIMCVRAKSMVEQERNIDLKFLKVSFDDVRIFKDGLVEMVFRRRSRFFGQGVGAGG